MEPRILLELFARSAMPILEAPRPTQPHLIESLRYGVPVDDAVLHHAKTCSSDREQGIAESNIGVCPPLSIWQTSERKDGYFRLFGGP